MYDRCLLSEDFKKGSQNDISVQENQTLLEKLIKEEQKEKNSKQQKPSKNPN